MTTFLEIVNSNSDLFAFYQEATKQRKDPTWCANLEWLGTGAYPESGRICLKFHLARVIDADDSLRPYRDSLLDNFRAAMPPCNHEGECSYNEFPPKPPAPNSETFQSLERGDKIIYDETSGPFGRIESTPPFVDLISALEGDPKPMPGLVPGKHGGWTFVRPKDDGDPVYVVLSKLEGRRLKEDLKYQERLDRKEISPRYAAESVYICSSETRELLLSEYLNKDSITGLLYDHPVVLTFRDPELEDKLATVCVAVATVLPIEPKLTATLRRKMASSPDSEFPSEPEIAAIEVERWFPDLDTFRAPFKKIVGILEAKTPDMPEEVLDGWLGKICRERLKDFPVAYAWPALLAAASVLVPRCGSRTNLFVALIGPPGSGKSSVFEYVFRLLRLEKPFLERLKSGSAEGLMAKIGDIGGAPRLFFPGELAHLLKKAAIEGSTFCETLSDLYYGDEQSSTIAKGKEINFNCRLTLAGGIPPESFGDLFGAASTQGLYQRFIFAECPTGFNYSYEELEKVAPVVAPRNGMEEEDPLMPSTGEAVAVGLADDVRAERDSWSTKYGIDQRVAGHAIRAAVIAASFDGRSTLRAADLGPALAFAKYQMRMRRVLAPNPGKNVGGILTFKVTAYLDKHAPLGQNVNERVMLQSVRAYDFGADTISRVLNSLEATGEIVRGRNGRQKIVRKNTDRLDN